MAQGHLKNEVFEEMLLSLKVGGFVIFTTREEYLEKYNYNVAINANEETGKWKRVKEVKFQKYANIEAGTKIGRYEAKDTMLYAYQKLV